MYLFPAGFQLPQLSQKPKLYPPSNRSWPRSSWSESSATSFSWSPTPPEPRPRDAWKTNVRTGERWTGLCCPNQDLRSVCGKMTEGTTEVFPDQLLSAATQSTGTKAWRLGSLNRTASSAQWLTAQTLKSKSGFEPQILGELLSPLSLSFLEDINSAHPTALASGWHWARGQQCGRIQSSVRAAWYTVHIQ